MPLQAPKVRTHRFPLPPPPGPWQWQQHWADLLFMHWQVSAASLRPHVPAGLELDAWNGNPWVSLVAFRLKQVRHRWLPSLGIVANIIELNLRTYVRYNDEPAIYFLSIHADKRLTVALARLLTPLPYARGCMAYESAGANWRFQCSRDLRRSAPLALGVTFTPHAESFCPPAGSPTEWLVERYGLYAADRHGNLLRTVVKHAPWRVNEVSVQCSMNSMGTPFDLDLARAPDLAHFSSGTQAHVWSFRRPNPRHQAAG